MLINVSELLSTPLKTEEHTAPIDMEFIRIDGVKYTFAEKEAVKLTISNVKERTLKIQVKINIVLNIPCNRCLEDVKTGFDVNVDRELDLSLTSDDRIKNLDETSYIDGNILDVDLLVYNEIMLRFPMKTLCSDTCKGICYHCGKNLNQGDCECDKESLDPRMSAIRDIFNNFKEV